MTQPVICAPQFVTASCPSGTPGVTSSVAGQSPRTVPRSIPPVATNSTFFPEQSHFIRWCVAPSSSVPPLSEVKRKPVSVNTSSTWNASVAALGSTKCRTEHPALQNSTRVVEPKLNVRLVDFTTTGPLTS